MSKGTVKIGIIGFGGMGTMHAEQIHYIDDAVVTAVVEPGAANRAKAEQFFADQGA